MDQQFHVANVLDKEHLYKRNDWYKKIPEINSSDYVKMRKIKW